MNECKLCEFCTISPTIIELTKTFILKLKLFIHVHPTFVNCDGKHCFFKERIAKGEKNVLTSQEPWMLAVTSGTTGKSCLIPKTRDNSKTFVEYGFAVGVYYTMYNVLPQVSAHTSINANID